MLKLLDIELLETMLLIIVKELHGTIIQSELLGLSGLWLLDVDLLQEVLILLEHELLEPNSLLDTDIIELKLLWLFDSELQGSLTEVDMLEMILKELDLELLETILLLLLPLEPENNEY